MEIIKKYKTISILVFLIIIVLIVGVFYKKSDLFENKEISKTTAKLTPTPTPDPFIHADKLNLPSSYMGYTFTKLASGSATLGKNAVSYLDKQLNLPGTEWLVKKDGVSESEFTKFKQDFKTFAKLQFFKLGWSDKSEYNKKELKPVSNIGIISNTWGYIKVSEQKYQVLLLKAEKDKQICPCDVQFRVFLSSIEDVNKLLE